MKKFDMKKVLPYIIAFVVFAVLSYAYAPQVLEKKVVNQSDISSWQGMAHEMNGHNAANPSDPALWSDSAFGGMPTYSYGVVLKGDVTKYIYDGLTKILSRPPVYLLLALLGGFLLFLAFGVNVWLAIVGAIAVAFCSYNMQIIQVGHNSKMVAIAFMPWVLASVVYAYRRNVLWGAVFTAFALSFQIKANHIQISYYLAIMIVALVVAEFVHALRSRSLKKFFIASAALLAAAVVGVAANANNLLPLREYSAYTMRGGSELGSGSGVGGSGAGASGARSGASASGAGSGARAGSRASKGLDLGYATAWSYGIEETPNLMIPNFNGGSSSGALSRDSQTYKVLRRGYQNPDEIIRSLPLYYGPQPFTAGPMYLGAIMVFLAVLALFVLKGRDKWWIFAVGIFFLLLSWGNHIMGFTRAAFAVLPLYNKFRTVSMALVALQVLVPLLAVLVIQKILFDEDVDKVRLRKGGIAALAMTAGFCLIVALVPSLFGGFVSPSDVSLPRDIAAALVKDRMGLLRADALRSLIFILLAAGVLVLGVWGKLRKGLCVGLLGVLVLVDLWAVDKRYLNDSHFVSRKQFDSPFPERVADRYLEDFHHPSTVSSAAASRHSKGSTHRHSEGSVATEESRVTDRHSEPVEESSAPVDGGSATASVSASSAASSRRPEGSTLRHSEAKPVGRSEESRVPAESHSTSASSVATSHHPEGTTSHHPEGSTHRHSEAKPAGRSEESRAHVTPATHYRVLDLSENTFNSAYTSYYHKSIGGYSPAKLSRYQDLIDNLLSREISAVASEINEAVAAGAESFAEISAALKYHPALAMLNCGFIIVDRKNLPIEYPYGQGAAYCVSTARWASSAAEEMALLKEIDTRREVVLFDASASHRHSEPVEESRVPAESHSTSDASRHSEGSIATEESSASHHHSSTGALRHSDAKPAGRSEESRATPAPSTAPLPHPGASVTLVEYSPNRLEYVAEASTDVYAVFSEIWYPAGWRAYIDGAKAPILRANYVLRALELPAGKHTIVFEFHPDSYYRGRTISFVASSILLLLLLAAAAVEINRKRR